MLKSARTAWRPPWRDIVGSPVHFFAFGFGAGLVPRAPGTFGTLVGIPFWFLLSGLSLPAYLAVVSGMALFGCWLCGASARRLGVHDFGGIVFDEIVGFLITCVPLLMDLSFDTLPDWLRLSIAFVLFRVFDIWKPWPIGWLDQKLQGGVGIMLDDVLAGVYAALVLLLILGLAGEPGF